MATQHFTSAMSAAAWMAQLNMAGNLRAPTVVVSGVNSYQVLATDGTLILNVSTTCRLNLLDPSSYNGRSLRIRTITASGLVISSNSNVSSAGTAGSAICGPGVGKWVDLESDGSTMWAITGNN